MIEFQYMTLMESGKAKMNQNDFTNARTDIESAKIIAETLKLDLSEVNKLLVNLNEQEKVARLANYIITELVFGDFKIAILRTNGKYGAIDASGIERINCKYRSTNLRPDGNRLFIIDDNHADIYDKNGGFIQSIDPSN
jgi:serine/threonine-protein kinase